MDILKTILKIGNDREQKDRAEQKKLVRKPDEGKTIDGKQSSPSTSQDGAKEKENQNALFDMFAVSESRKSRTKLKIVPP